MLRLENIVKKYEVADEEFAALKGINISFRKSEFVSILGPSGCGKTTTLNIIGGLDKYSSGDLIINGKSTKEFGDHDWDIYRNESIGFVFQSYNLIPHQTVLGNVELALTISGVEKSERQERAKAALDKVGLAGQYNKKPNQLSGGQCQRVAIARALVNNPKILLADEPTGALDSETSIQIMELIKELSKDHLVIMVTHNPELANKYSTRIIKLLDGLVISDSNPFSSEAEIKEVTNSNEKEISLEAEKTKDLSLKEIKKYKKTKNNAKMSFFTAFRLSLRNLLSKWKRTIMVSIAGCIGIFGISAVLAVSNGVNGYIDGMQDDMLSGNPITVSESGYDLTTLMGMSTDRDKKEALEAGDYVNVNSMIEYLVENSSDLENIFFTNELSDNYINYLKAMPKEYYQAMSFDYGINFNNNIYTSFKRGETSSDVNLSVSALTSIYKGLLEETTYSKYASIISSLGDAFSLSIPNEDYILSQYNVLSGKIASNKNEIMLVLDENSEVTDLVLAELGYYTQEEFFNLIYKSTDDSRYNASLYKKQFNYDEMLNKTFTYYPNNTIFSDYTGIDTKPFTYNAYQDPSWTTGLELKVVGVIEPKNNISYGALSSGFYYTDELAKYALESSKNSNIVNYYKSKDISTITSGLVSGVEVGITYNYSYDYMKDNETTYTTYNKTGFLGGVSQMSAMSPLLGMGGATDTYEITVRELGGKDSPETISIYPIDFDNKDLVTDYLDEWNSKNDILINGVTLTSQERDNIKYTDSLELIISMINGLIDMVTIALIGFTALSLIVSTVMVGIITYVSVVERTKEIGVIRSLGGRKKDVSHLFNAETFIIGLTSGVFGVTLTYLLSLVANIGLKGILGFNLFSLKISVAFIMIIISVLLTLISGIFPARSAAHKNPVEALRSE